VVIHYLDFVRAAVTPGEADPPAIIDPNAMLAGTVPFQCFQVVAPNGDQVGETRGGVQPAQPLACLSFDPAKLPAAKSFVDRLGFRTSERANHTR
jgi:hypothetical protein